MTLKEPITPEVSIPHTKIIHIFNVLIKTRQMIYNMTIKKKFEILIPPKMTLKSPITLQIRIPHTKIIHIFKLLTKTRRLVYIMLM